MSSPAVERRRAAARAARIYPNSAGFQSAYKHGAAAAVAGRSTDSCPYRRDTRNTWRQRWREAWLRGYLSVRGDETAS